MAEENKKEAPPVPSAKPTDAERIEVLEQLVEDNKKHNAALNEHIELANKRIKELENQLKTAQVKKVAPEVGVVHLDGKPWKIKGTVQSKDALEEVRRGHIPENVVLVITDKPA